MVPMPCDTIEVSICRQCSGKNIIRIFFSIYTKDDIFIREMMQNLCKKAGVEKFGFHAIRHHVALILEDSGKATLREIQKMLRHKRVSTTDDYLKGLSPEMKRVAGILDNPEKSKLVVVKSSKSQT